ncbi:MAG: tRNA (guanosine(37)-N1)-methyltransferase TrmD [Oscillospiraceae bacterium]|nr:tRNA (guanosine(37)-N1)-methyltransferase TrmD [Oscillospiraceae bacterium]
MNIDILTLFPEICEVVINSGIIGRAVKKGIINVKCHQIRDFTTNKHKKVDDSPFGGGYGMVMMAEPIFRAFNYVCELRNTKPYLIFMSPKGKMLSQENAKEKLIHKNIAILCGRYEAVDERLIEEIVDEQISIGNYVLTGGELPAMVFLDVLLRMIPDVLPSKVCFENESHYNNLLEHPQYTRPRVWHDKPVPEVLISGNHKEIEKWKLENSIEIK